MICPYRKQTETVDGTTSEYYIECYGTECPYYVAEKHFSGGLHTEPYCNRADPDLSLLRSSDEDRR